VAFELPPLPYPEDALEPVVSGRTLSFHYGKHHKAYVDNLNKLTEGSGLAEKPLAEVIKAVAGDPSKVGVFNNAAQVWNHTFLWNSMRPGGGGAPSGDLADRINAVWGSYEKFAEEFKAAAVGRFGSGWAWLVSEAGSLKIVTTPNAETPLTTAATPLFTTDVWEHAYYLDFQNRRPDYVQAFLDSLVNWDFAAANLAKA
jgi:Fe-Mn family superoxide dismutase